MPLGLRRTRATEQMVDALVPRAPFYIIALHLAAIVPPHAAKALLTVARNFAQRLLECRVKPRPVFIRHTHSAALGEHVYGGEIAFEALLRVVGEQGGKAHGNVLERRTGCAAPAFNGVANRLEQLLPQPVTKVRKLPP